MKKRLSLVLFALILCFLFSAFSGITGTLSAALNPTLSTNIPYTEKQVQQLTTLLQQRPTADEFLETYYLGKIDNDNKLALGYTAPIAGSRQITTIPDGEELTVVAFYPQNNRFCVIVNSKNQACWVDAICVSLSTGTDTIRGASRVPYTDKQIRELSSLLNQAPKDDELLETACLGRIDNDGKAARGFSAPISGARSIITIPDGEELTVVGFFPLNNRYCVIYNSRNMAYWVDAICVSLSTTPTTKPTPTPSSRTTTITSDIPYTEKQIRQLTKLLYQSPTDDEFLETFYLGKIDNDGKAARGFNAPIAGARSIMTIPDGEEVTVVAFYPANNRYCVIYNARNQAFWVDAICVSLSIF